MHFGNPFSHLPGTLAGILVGSRDEAVQAFGEWLDGTAWQEVEPARRLWILENIESLRGKELVCFCAPLLCHGSILAARADCLCSPPAFFSGCRIHSLAGDENASGM